MKNNQILAILNSKIKNCGSSGGEPVDTYTKTQTDNLLLNKVDKEEGKGLFSGSYNDLTNKPSIPSKITDLTDYSDFATNESVEVQLEQKADKASITELNSNLHDLEFEGWTIPDGMPLKDISKVGRVDLSTLTWNYDSTNNRYTSDDISNSAKFVDDATVATNLYCTTQPINKSANDVWAGTNGVAIGSTGIVWYKNESTSSTVKPSGYLYYELATAKTQTEQNAFDKVNESLSDYGFVAKEYVSNDFLQGLDINGNITSNNYYVCNKNIISANAGDTITVKSIANSESYVALYDGSTFKSVIAIPSSSINNFVFSIPSGSNGFRISIGVNTGVTPSTIGEVKIYTNNAIDELKNDLDTLEADNVFSGNILNGKSMDYFRNSPSITPGDYVVFIRHYDNGYLPSIGCIRLDNSGNFLNYCYYLGTTEKVSLTCTNGVIDIENRDNYDYICILRKLLV